MLELRRKIIEVNPDAVVCQDSMYKKYADELLSGLGLKCVLIERSDYTAMFFGAEKAVWIGSEKPPLQGHYDFVYSFTGGV